MTKTIKFLLFVLIGMLLSFLVDANLNYLTKLILISMIFLPVNIFQSDTPSHHTDINS